MLSAQALLTIRREAVWLCLIAVTGSIAIAGNYFGLLFGISIILPHLFYLPIVLASYRFPRQGLVFSVAISLIYLLMIGMVAGGNTAELVSGASRAVVFVGIGWIIAALSLYLTKERELYRGLFDNAEAGAAVVRAAEKSLLITEANYRLAQTLKSTIPDLRGQKLAAFWEDDAGREFFAGRVRKDGACYAYEARWKRADGSPVDVLVSAGKISPEASVITVIDITGQKNTEASLKNANAILNVLSRLMRNDLMAKVSEASRILENGENRQEGGQGAEIIPRLDAVVRSMKRRLELAGSFQNLGSEPAAWQPLQELIQREIAKHPENGVAIRPWLERLEIYADNHISEVFFNLIDNAIRYGETTTEIVITYHILPEGIEIIVEDDGRGIHSEEKETIFEYGSMTHGGFGLFIDRQILGVTGISLRENGVYGKGGRFVLHVPREGYRIV